MQKALLTTLAFVFADKAFRWRACCFTVCTVLVKSDELLHQRGFSTWITTRDVRKVVNKFCNHRWHFEISLKALSMMPISVVNRVLRSFIIGDPLPCFLLKEVISILLTVGFRRNIIELAEPLVRAMCVSQERIVK